MDLPTTHIITGPLLMVTLLTDLLLKVIMDHLLHPHHPLHHLTKIDPNTEAAVRVLAVVQMLLLKVGRLDTEVEVDTQDLELEAMLQERQVQEGAI